MGLENTGLLDDSTKKAMSARRCGRPDVAHSGELRWHKNRLTYFVEDGGNHLSRDDARSALKEAIAKWSSVIPLDFVEVENSGEADLKIGFRTGRHDDEDSFDGPGTILAHAFYPTDGHVHFDDDEEWVVKDTGRIREGAADLVGVATHELGHALGFDHVYGSAHKDDIMFPSWSPNFDSNGNYVPNRLTDNDIEVAQAIYGVRDNNNGGGGDEPNDGGDNGGGEEIPRRPPTQPKWNFPTFDFGDDDKNPDDFFKNFMNNIPHTPGFHKFNFGDGNPTNGGFFHDDGNGNQQWSYHWESSSGRK